jgi:hypothetical protein
VLIEIVQLQEILDVMLSKNDGATGATFAHSLTALFKAQFGFESP